MCGYKLFFWYKLWFYGLMLIAFGAKAASSGDIRASYPSDFGQVLVGSASIAHNSVQWTGSEISTRLVTSGVNLDFGFTGKALYGFTETRDVDTANKWVIESYQTFIINSAQANGSAPSIGYFFAPEVQGESFEQASYSASFLAEPSFTKPQLTKGTGKLDDQKNPVLTLDVESDVKGTDCSNVQQCKDVAILPRNEVTFTITPRSKDPSIQYAHVSVYIDEQDVDCSSLGSGNYTFQERELTQVSFEPKDYFQILNGFGPNGGLQGICHGRRMPMLVSINKPFVFKATNLRETKVGGYAQYRFFLNGHWDENDTTNSKWPGGHKIFRLRTSTAATPTPVPSNPTVDFTPEVNGNTVLLTSNVTPSTGATIKGYIWTISSLASTSTVLPQIPSIASPTVTLEQGSYSISLQVTDSNQKVSPVTSQTVTVKGFTPQANDPLTATFTAIPQIGTAPLTVNLDASASTGATSYSWQSSNQLSKSGATSQMVFANAGTYTITLTTSNGQSATKTEQRTITVNPAATSNSKPVAYFIVTPDTKNQLQLTLDASNSTNNITSYDWYVVNSETKISEHLTKSTATTTYTLPSKGSYVVTLIVTDSSGNKATVSNTIAVPSLNASFTATPTAGGYPLTVKLDASTSTAADNNKIVSYKWFTNGISNILDGITSSVTFLNPLDYVITLFVTDDKGQVDSSSQLIKVSNPLPPIADFVATPATANGKETLTINLDASNSNDPNGGNIVNYQWCCDATGSKNVSTPKTSFTLTDNRGGDYKFSLIVSDNDGNGTGTGSNSTVVEKTITLNKPEVKFCDTPDSKKKMVIYGSDDSLSLDVSCSILKPSSSAPDSKIVGYSWSVRDDNNNTVRAFAVLAQESPITTIPLHYTPGNYTVVAKAVETYGLYNWYGREVAVVPPALGDAAGTGVNQTGTAVSTNAKFYAGAFANNGVVNNFSPSENVALLASIAIDSAHSGQQADILAVLLNTDTSAWYYKNNTGEFTPWDFTAPKALSNLGNAETATTLSTAVRHIKVWNASATTPFPLSKGHYSLFVGYRLTTGNIVFNLHPLSFTVR